VVNEFKLPDVGEGLTEAEMVSWQVAVGDTVAVNDVLCEIETAKSVVELPSPFAGVVSALLVAVGESVSVGTPIVRIGSPADDAPPPLEPALDLVPDVSPTATLVGYGPREASSARRLRRVPVGRVGAQPPSVGRVGAQRRIETAPSVVPLAKPPVRALARERRIDISTLAPTGPRGDVTAADVKGAAEPEPATYPGRVTREPLKGVRRQMAMAMTSSLAVPQASVWTTVDVSATMRTADAKPLWLIARGVVEALGRHPLLNAVLEGDEVVLRHYVNLGIAAATPRGLIVPNIKDADLRPLEELGAAITDLTAVARSGKTQPADQQHGTFTITNVGPLGMDGGTPILNPGESGILAVGAITKRPWVVEAPDGESRLAVRSVCTLALSFDHRIIDGATAAAFLADVAASL
jgi:2-oxoisovalerate dehydrogenase E2 component (dihydrolipoyl transacylase)